MSHASELIATDIDAYLAQHERKELLRFLTCGSVDDGKSTLIGRLLYDSKMIYEDQLAAIRDDSIRIGTTGTDFDPALLTDGLKAEREQGITIDVAYRYFSTAKRKFIIADTPGHEQYTRNMVTGASTCDMAIILIDARHGVLTQTKRHSFIVSLLGIKTGLAFEGVDLVTATIDADRAIYLEALAPLVYHGWAPLHGLRSIDAKYIEAPTPEYYDLLTDPAELNNLLERDASAGAQLADDLQRRLQAWPTDEDATANTKPLNSVAVRRLAALGYVATGGPEDAPASHRFDPKDVVPLFETLNGEKPEVIRERARAIVMTPKQSLVVYRRGLILAQVARQQMPADVDSLALVGMAQYRLGRFDRALIDLAAARDRRVAAGSDPDPATTLFVAMTLHRLGRVDAARRQLKRATTLVRTNSEPVDDVTRRAFEEAENLLAKQVLCHTLNDGLTEPRP